MISDQEKLSSIINAQHFHQGKAVQMEKEVKLGFVATDHALRQQEKDVTLGFVATDHALRRQGNLIQTSLSNVKTDPYFDNAAASSSNANESSTSVSV